VELDNFSAQRVVLHEVFRRIEKDLIIQPEYNDELEQLEPEALDALHDRVIRAMAHKTKSVPMAITDKSADAMIRYARKIANSDDDDNFIEHSKKIALKLASKQTSKKLPGGVVVTIFGTYGVPVRRIVCIIKAEVDSGFTRNKHGGEKKLQYLKSLMLTAQTKLYKVGMFVERENIENEDSPENGWDAYIYDDALSACNRDDAAAYFYGDFLGLGFPQTSARQTRNFHNLTKEFIQSMSVDEEEKIDLHNALVTYLKVDQSPTVGTASFADAYLSDDDVKQAYSDHMTKNGFSAMPVKKDISDIQMRLKFRKITFRSAIKITGPADEINKLVNFEVIDGEATLEDPNPKWTQVLIKDRISAQE
jgi:hypothetical protein